MSTGVTAFWMDWTSSTWKGWSCGTRGFFASRSVSVGVTAFGMDWTGSTGKGWSCGTRGIAMVLSVLFVPHSTTSYLKQYIWGATGPTDWKASVRFKHTSVQVGTGSLSIDRCTLYQLFYVFLHKFDVLFWSFLVVFVNATLDVFATFLTNCAATHSKIWTCASPRMKQMVIHNNVKIRLVGRAIFKVMNPKCAGCLTFFDIFPWLVH